MTDKGFTDKIKGKVKETTGDITNDKELKAEGLVDQAKGKVKKASSDIKEASEEIKEKVEKKLDKHK
ncbi:CsbD family protein [Vagococcus carniphilus]|uniref:CsbD family protein n=1 Tax=Vagococcus carniphilus TaxID=218144 RepID=UPI003B5CC1A9